MAVTEQEAREKWCPFARAFDYDDSETGGRSIAGTNRDVHGKPRKGSKCLASACMAWRWEDALTRSTLGCCGLAGGTL